MTRFDHIIQFFLDIFHLQSTVPDTGNWRKEYQLISSGSAPDRIYELRISSGTEVKSRRMSARQIGQSVESKSACYMITYDDFLVIKIPPVPPADFKIYLENIDVEQSISRQLSPTVLSLTPSLSVILGRVPEILKKINPDSKAGNEEETYIRLLEKEPRYQRFLKIDGQFVFFMGLSQHAFFDQVIEKIHGEKDRMSDEMMKTSHVFEDLAAFENLFGSGNEAFFFRFNGLIKRFHSNLDALFGTAADPYVAPDYERREWLFASLADQHPQFGEDMPAGFPDKIHQLLSQVMDENRETVEDYYNQVRACVRKKIFDNHQTKIEILIIKTLTLLHHLKNQGIGIRDLKPDNILVAGKKNSHQCHLSDPDDYDLGLIDLETAVRFRINEGEEVRQPMLAGTPSYMTPSHLFCNPTLNDVFEIKMPGIFHLQDWYAVTGIIFNIATGHRLFEKTAKLIPEIIRVRTRGIRKNTAETELLKNAGRIFWKTAMDEFKQKIQDYRERLGNIRLSLPGYMIDGFRLETENTKARLIHAMENRARSQKLFTRQAQQLIDASLKTIQNQRIKWEKNDPEQNVPPYTREQIMALFMDLETFKQRLARLDENSSLIKPSVSCEELLTFMFHQVAIAMDF
jgi:serine/threonine protein kinase